MMMVGNCRVVFGVSAGIGENIQKPASLFKKNLTALYKILDSAEWNNITRLCFVGSSCLYPVDAPQPFKEESLGTGAVEPTSAPFAYSKLAGWQLCKAISKQFGHQYFMAVPSDLYGDPDDTHFIGDLIRKFHIAKREHQKAVTLWGTGTPIRQPLLDEDFDKLLKFVCENYRDTEPINIAATETVSIARTAGIIRDVVGFSGDVIFDCSKPDGQMKKQLDNSKLLKLGGAPFTPLEKGIELSYKRFLNAKNVNVL